MTCNHFHEPEVILNSVCFILNDFQSLLSILMHEMEVDGG